MNQYGIDIIQKHLDICKKYYNSIYENVAGCFQKYLSKIPTLLAEKSKKDLSIHLYSDIELQSERNPTEIFRNFDRFFFLNW